MSTADDAGWEGHGGLLEIDLAAIVANWRRLRDLAAPAECAAVVKADAYGLGAGPVAGALAGAGCRTFFVALPQEGVAVRAAVGAAPMVAVLAGYLPDAAPLYRDAALSPVLSTPEQVATWSRAAGGSSAWLHLDTGMCRLGLSLPEWAALGPSADLSGRGIVGVMSHLACAEDSHDPMNRGQLTALRAALANLPGPIMASLANSSGIFLGSDYHLGLVRPGAALYGVNPTPGQPNPMRPVVRLRGRILQVRQIDRGEAVGYGASFVASAPRKLATVAVGYADGLHRALGNRGRVACQSFLAPIVGRVSMDMITIDVTDAPNNVLQDTDSVDILGPEYDVDAMASDAGTIGYEILTSLGSRFRRRYLGHGAQ